MGDQLTPDQLKEYEALKAQKAELALKEAKLRLQTRLKESGLPEKAQAQVAKVFEGQADFSDEQVDAEIASVRELVDSLKEAAPSTTRSPSGLGGSQDDEGRLQVGDEKRDRWAKAMDGFFDGGRAVDGVPAFGGLHEAYASIEGRWDNPESMADAIMGGIMMSLPRRDSDYFENHRTKLQENFKAMVPVTLKEAITTSDFPTLFGDSMFKRLQKEYTEDPRNDWRQVISSVENLRDATNPVNVPRVGGQTILPVVNQNSPYQEGTDPSEVNEQLTPAKRGRLLKLTWEDVLADNVSVLRRIPRILARSSNRTIQQVVFDEIENNPAMADAVNLIDAGHSNLVSGSPALTYSAFADAVQLLREQTEQDSGDRLGLSPWMLLVGPALEDTAIEIARSRVGKVGSTNEDQTVTNANAEWGVRAHASIALGRTGAKENHWYVMANPRDAETIVVGFLGGRDRPDIFVQGIDTPTAGSFFDADAITFKARLVVAAKVVDHRWIVGSLA